MQRFCIWLHGSVWTQFGSVWPLLACWCRILSFCVHRSRCGCLHREKENEEDRIHAAEEGGSENNLWSHPAGVIKDWVTLSTRLALSWKQDCGGLNVTVLKAVALLLLGNGRNISSKLITAWNVHFRIHRVGTWAVKKQKKSTQNNCLTLFNIMDIRRIVKVLNLNEMKMMHA